MLMHKPVLYAPKFKKPFKLAVDASDVGAGAVLLQEDDLGIEHPICYFSKRFEKSQKNYCTSEKELLALVLALQYFEVYVSALNCVYRSQSISFSPPLKEQKSKIIAMEHTAAAI